MRTPITVLKADGTREPFDKEKLRRSLATAGASSALVTRILEHLERGEFPSGIKTSEIYEHAFSLLAKAADPAAGRYSLKRAVAAFGPTGFPFEKYVAALFAAQGFATATNIFVRGQCAEHELDIAAWNNERLVLVEAKFHAEMGLRSDLKVALYVKARFDDVKSAQMPFGKGLPREMWLVTNTKFTDHAAAYGACAGVRLVGWNHPANGNLHDMIERAELHPVTSLASIPFAGKAALLSQGIVLCSALKADPRPLSAIGLSEEEISRVREEIERVCHAVISS